MNLPNLQNESSGIFIPFEGGFRELTDAIPIKSINAITEHLGYHTDQVYPYFDLKNKASGINEIVFEIFSDNIVFILTQKSVLNLTKESIESYLSNFEIHKLFDSHRIDELLKNGIETESLTIDFLSRILNIEDPAPEGMFYSEKISKYLFFNEGLLVDFQSSDGLNKAAKNWKDVIPDVFDRYEKAARLYWGDNLNKIINEVNIQAESYEKLAHASKNEFIPFHYTKEGTVNYYMLLVSHYNLPILLKQFLTINHGRFNEIGINKFQVGRFGYDFANDGSLIRSYLLQN